MSEEFSEEEKNPAVLETTDAIASDPEALQKVGAATSSLGYDLTTEELDFIVHKLGTRSFDESIQVLKDAYEYHKDDINIDYDQLMRMKKLCEGHQAWPELSLEDYEFEVKFETCIFADWSPYAEVRASTSMLDDPNEPCETLRMYIIGMIYANAGCLVGTFFTNRFPSISLPFLALQLLIYPSGMLMHYILPDKTFRIFGIKIALNPGPWTFKEQMLASQMMSAVDGAPNSVTVITQQRAATMYNLPWASDYGYMVLITLTGQFLGYGFAGLLRSVLVYPVKCMWYGILPLLAMNRTLTKREQTEVVHGWKMKRYTFFGLFLLISFCWWWFPEFVFTALSYFSWITWISPQNVKLAAVTGVFNGLGFNPISTFDWNNIGGSGMVSPFYTTYASFGGQILGFIVIVAIYFSRTSYTNFLPINATGVYDNTGASYDVNMVIDDGGRFDNDKYQAYSPAFLSAGALVQFGGKFAFYVAAIVYTILYYRDQVVDGCKSMWISMRNEEKARGRYDDPFTRAMKIHPEVPAWWFVSTIIISLVLFIVMVEVYKETETPVWTIFFATLINIIFIMPMGLLYAQTDTYFTVSFFIKILMGYMKPHNANAMLITEFITGNFWEQAQNYITNQKQTHYAKMPSRALFRAQFSSTLITTFTSLALLRWEFTGIKDYCEPDQAQKFTCASALSDFASTILWGTIGPKAYFNNNGLYPALKYCFLIGAFLPLPIFFIEKIFKKQLRRWNVLIILSGFYNWAPNNFLYVTGNFYIGALFNWYIRKYYLRWWQKYNYVLYAALGTGVGFGAVILFFATSYKHIVNINWWGNYVYAGGPNYDGADYLGIPLDSPPASKGYFGPDPGSFPNAL